ncbi:MAG: DUF4287 domain-containing protein [Chloroflexi bacterium]|nr:DUF4287 domain-containing protein [Chloroflexota bacterium]
MPMTPEQMWAKIAENLPAKTGRSLAEWVQVVWRGPYGKRKDRIAWLKAEFGLGHGQAQVVADEAAKSADYVAPTADQRLEAQYRGPKAALRPLYDQLATAIVALGPDVQLAPRQSYVAFSRGRRFALLQPSTPRRLDLGLVLPGVAPTGRLQAAAGFGSGRTTHRVALTSSADMGDEVLAWLRAAYEAGR